MSLEQQILNQYDIEIKEINLLRHNENMTYQVKSAVEEYVLRIHKSIDTMNLSLLAGDLKPDDLSSGEMHLLEYLAENSTLGTQIPIKNKTGSFVTRVGETYATLIRWIPGDCIVKKNLNSEIAGRIGNMLAKMHDTLSGFEGKYRYTYAQELADRMLEFCDTVLECSNIRRENQCIIKTLICKIKAMLEESYKDLLIVHNDLGVSNLLIVGQKIVPIDFSLSGICVKEMDLASLYCHFEDEDVRKAILQGYEEISKTAVDMDILDICIGYQILIFVFCQYQIIQSQGWFEEALNYWCEEIFTNILQGERIQAEIGLYS